MVAPNVKQRYANAAEALEALKQPILVVKDATWLETLVDAMKGRKLAALLGLTTVGVVAVVGTILMIPQRLL